MILIGGSKELRQAVERAVTEAQNRVEQGTRELFSKFRTVEDLRKEIVNLEIGRDKLVEDWARKEREVEHKVGLERKRQEFEITQAKRETEVKVREENLQADKERFKSEMEFQRKHLEDEISALRTLVGQMLERLPSAEIFHRTGDKK